MQKAFVIVVVAFALTAGCRPNDPAPDSEPIVDSREEIPVAGLLEIEPLPDAPEIRDPDDGNGRTGADAPSHSMRDSSGIRIVESQAPSSDRPWVISSPVVTIGETFGRSEYHLFRVSGATRLSDGRIVLANSGSNELRWFDSHGGFLRSAGGSGGGPGEFLAMSGLLRLAGDSILAADFRQRRGSIYDPDGEFVRSIPIPPLQSPVARFDDGSYLLLPGGFALGDQGPTRVERLPLDIHRFREGAREGELLQTLPGSEMVIGPTGGVRPDGSHVIGRSGRPFGRGTSVVGGAEGWVVGDNARPQIDFYDSSGALSLIARWNAAPRPVTRQDVAAWRADVLARNTDPERHRRLQQAWAEHPEPPETMPAFGLPLHRDREGNIWVQEYNPAGRDELNEFRIFAPSGVWLATLRAPSGLRILEIGSDYLIGVTVGELDVEVVSLHWLER
jgi:hypothetical protein